MRRTLIIIAGIIVLGIIAVIIIFLNWGTQVFATVGGIGTWILIFYLISPQRVKIILGDIAGVFSFLGQRVRRFQVKNKVEGYINTVTDEFDKSCCGATQYPMKLKWVTQELAPKSYLESGRVIVRLKHKNPAFLNVVASAIAYCRAGLLADTRQYIRKPLLRAIDLLVVDIILNKNNLRDGQRYFRTDILPKELEQYGNTEPWFNILRKLEDAGYYRRIFMEELVDYPNLAKLGACDESHRKEICDFTSFLSDIVENQPGGETSLDFLHKRLRIGVIIVGKSEKLLSAGHVPYIEQIEKCRGRGAQAVYVIGVKERASEIPGIVKEAEYLNLVNIIDIRKLTGITYRDGSVVSGYCAQLEVRP